MASAIVMRAPAEGQSNPLIGCSPIDVADPTYPAKKELLITL